MIEAWNKNCVVLIFKFKGDVQVYENYRWIKLISHSITIYEKIIDKRVRSKTSVKENSLGLRLEC